MPLELQIIRACEFIRVGTTGRPDMERSRAVLRELVAACRRRGISQALLDVREIRQGPDRIFTPKQIAELVNTFHEMGFSNDQKMAVLYSQDPHRGIRLFAFVSMIHGWKVRAFDKFEDALQWLATTEDATKDDPEFHPLPTATGTSGRS